MNAEIALYLPARLDQPSSVLSLTEGSAGFSKCAMTCNPVATGAILWHPCDVAAPTRSSWENPRGAHTYTLHSGEWRWPPSCKGVKAEGLRKETNEYIATWRTLRGHTGMATKSHMQARAIRSNQALLEAASNNQERKRAAKSSELQRASPRRSREQQQEAMSNHNQP